jgi:hypothetical protein
VNLPGARIDVKFPTIPTSTIDSSDESASGGEKSLLDEVVRLLLPREQAEQYIRRFPGKAFTFYVYDLPSGYDLEDVNQCLESKYPNASNCDWGSSICIETYSQRGQYSTLRYNRNADFVISKVLAEYQGPLRTNDPSQAELFVVPYPSAAYCMCHSKNHRCATWVTVSQLESVFANLTYLNEDTRHRHLFLDSVDVAHPYFKAKAPLLASIGWKTCPTVVGCGQLVIPYANTSPQNQPNEIRHTTFEEKVYALSAFMSPKIDARSDDRLSFFEEYERLPNNQTLAGLPTLVNGLHGRKVNGEANTQQAYRDSVFCPSLRGDYPPQKRFFDVLLSGCIPVVLAHASREPQVQSYFAPGAPSVVRTYPHAIGSFDGWPEMGIDYDQIVVSVNATCGMPCMFPMLEDLLINQPDVIREKQRAISRLAPLLSFGMEQNGLQHSDAVAALLVHARHYVNSRNSNMNTSQHQP